MADSEFVELALDDARTRMAKSIDSFKRELGTVRTGRAQPSLVDRLRVDYYGSRWISTSSPRSRHPKHG